MRKIETALGSLRKCAPVVKAALLFCAATTGIGCSTASTKFNNQWGEMYSGVRCVSSDKDYQAMSYVLPFSLVAAPDYLFSAAADTALLPIDFVVRSIRRNSFSGCGRMPPLKEIETAGKKS